MAAPLRVPLALAAAVLALALPKPAAPEQARLWLEIDAPDEGRTHVGPVGLVLVRGFAGIGDARGHDVVILLDTSVSTLDPAGFDVDGNGSVGRRLRSADDPLRAFNPRRLCNDPGDTVQRAELQAARELVDSLHASGRSRVALVSFDAMARTLTPLGASRAQSLAALAELEASLAAPAGSDVARALEAAGRLLADGDPERPRSVILLSDGAAWSAGSSAGRAARRAEDAAASLGTRGVRIHTFALGQDADGGGLLERIAGTTGGAPVRVDDLRELAPRLAHLDLSPVAALELRNATVDRSARAVRLFPDGGFDAVVPLEPGENRIRIRARAPDGTERTAWRRVTFDRRRARTLEEARAVAADLEALHHRTLELELAAAVERERALAERRVVELEAEDR